jgi:SAM-dependent methyltransferase
MAEPAIDPGLDSGIDDNSDTSSATSLTSHQLVFPEEHGRTYHAYYAGIYPYPNDEREQNRLDMQHHLFSLTFSRKLCLAPIHRRKLNRVLDVGTGTGLWAIDFAEKHPEAIVYGEDLSPSRYSRYGPFLFINFLFNADFVQVQPNFVPPNVLFTVDNLELDWMYKKPFELIYCRMMNGSFADWPRFFQQAFEYIPWES